MSPLTRLKTSQDFKVQIHQSLSKTICLPFHSGLLSFPIILLLAECYSPVNVMVIPGIDSIISSPDGTGRHVIAINSVSGLTSQYVPTYPVGVPCPGERCMRHCLTSVWGVDRQPAMHHILS